MIAFTPLVLETGDIRFINPFQVSAAGEIQNRDDRCAVVLSGLGLIVVLGDIDIVLRVLAGDEEAIEEYRVSWVEPAAKEGPRKVAMASPGGKVVVP